MKFLAEVFVFFSVFMGVCSAVAVYAASDAPESKKRISKKSKIPDFRIDNGLLTASEPYSINFGGLNLNGVCNQNTGLYDLNLPVLYPDIAGLALDNSVTLHSFFYKEKEYWFVLESSQTEWGYLSNNLKDIIPENLSNLLTKLKNPLVIGKENFSEELKEVGAITDFFENLVTSGGIVSSFILISLNNQVKVDKWDSILWHETGHAIIADCIIESGISYESNCYVWMYHILEQRLVESVIKEKFNGDYSIIEDSVSDYGKTSLAETVAETVNICGTHPEVASAFSSLLYKKLLEYWQK